MSTAQRADEPVLVTGATGLHGGAVTRALLAGNRRARAFTRDSAGPRGRWLSELGAEVITGDLLDTESLTSAMQGTSAVYAVTTPFSVGPEGEIEQGEHIIAAAREAQLTWLILASVASAD
ncbi:MAG: NmrA family NAD(P)-binding protein, partial [Solirubrobacterales bacterium]|nr:NmrA family NAD(P)-binding protein [Solirubrobacterales bacterium]